MAKTE